MYTVTAIKKTDPKISMSFTSVTSVTEVSTNQVIVCGGITITLASADWSLLVAQYIPATT